MKKRFFLLLLFFVTVSVFGQNKQFTLEDCIYMNRNIFPKSVKNLQWMPKSAIYSAVVSDSFYSYLKNDTLYSDNAKFKNLKMILSLDEFNSHLANSGIYFEHFPSITWINKDEFSFSKASSKYKFNIKSHIVSLLGVSPEGENIDESNIYNYYAYTIGQDLFVTQGTNRDICVAKSEADGILYGSDRVHRNEFGITKGTFWSPKDNYLAFYRMDESMVTNYPLVDITTRIATVENTRYPMAGMASHEVTIGIYNLATRKTVYLKTGEPKDQYLTSVTWDPSEKYIYVGVLNREQNHLWLNKYDVVTGNFIKTLFEEKDTQYVEPETGLMFICKNATQFLWKSRRNGWNHLYKYDTEGNLLAQLTKGKWEVIDVLGFNNKETELYITSTEESPVQTNIYAVNVSNSTTKRLSKNHGTHQALLSFDKDFIIDVYSSTDVVRVIDVIDVQGKVVKNIMGNTNPIEDYAVGNIIMGTLQNAVGQDLYYRLITPPNFDPNKQYPVFFYVYGGPHLQMVTDSWNAGAGFWDLRWAQRGYIVFSMDNRGTPNRGADFEQSIHRNLGTVELEDQMIGVQCLKSLPCVDNGRMAVDGWSYGGFMTISLMLKYPDVFKVGVAGGPVIDWKYYEVMYGERYMDTPEENPEGYEHASLLNYVDNLKGDLMVIHCTTDPVVVWQNSLDFIDKCVDAGVQLDYFVYPGHEHNVRGKDRMHLYQKIEKYIDNALK